MEENKFLKERLMTFDYVFWSVVFGCILSFIPAMVIWWLLLELGFVEEGSRDPVYIFYLGTVAGGFTSCLIMWAVGNEQIRSNFPKKKGQRD